MRSFVKTILKWCESFPLGPCSERPPALQMNHCRTKELFKILGVPWTQPRFCSGSTSELTFAALAALSERLRNSMLRDAARCCDPGVV